MAKKFPLEIVIGAIDKFSTTFSQFGSKLDRLGSKADRLGKSLSMKVTAPMTLLGAFALRSAGNLEQLEIRFSSLLGSAEAAGDMMIRLKKFAASTPFDLNDVANASAALLAAGFAAETLETHLKTLGDIAAGSGGSLADMVPLFTEIRLKGKAFTQDLRQFATRGIPIVAVLAKQLGVSEAKIFKMAEQGKITFPKIEQALRSMTEAGGLFADQMGKQSRSIFGIWGAFADTITFASAELGKAMAKSVNLGDNLERLGGFIKDLTTSFTNLSPQTQKWIVYAGLAVAVIGPLLVGIAGLISVITFLAPAFALMFSITGLWVVGLTALAGMAIYLGKALADLVNMAGGWGNVFMMLGGAILDFLIQPLTSALKLIVSIWDYLGKAPEGLRRMAGFSFAQAAANSAVAGESTPGVKLNSQDAMKKQADFQNAVRFGDKAAIEVMFKNPPQGMKASVVENSGTNVSIDQGVSMQGGY